MVHDNLVVGLFYWLRVYDFSLVCRNVVAKIIAIDSSGPILNCWVKVLDPATGELYEIKSCSSHDFNSEINITEVRKMVEDLSRKLNNFTEQ